MKPRILAFFLTLVAAVSAGAEQHYIVHGPPGAVQNLASRHGLMIVRQADVGGQKVALLADPGHRSTSQVMSAAQADPQSSGISDIEPDNQVALPEAAPVAHLNQSTVAILDALRNRGTMPFYGDAAWSAYVGQPAVGIIRLDDARVFGTGSRRGPIAIIDTGVDPNHPILRGSLTWGYDFVNDRPGIPSEWADLDQSTVAILDGRSSSVLNSGAVSLNQSTVAILDQSTVAILDGLKSRIPPAFGHGTMVAGLIHLVAPTASIMPLKAFSADGTGSLYDVISAIYYAVDSGASVINMSFSLDTPSKELRAALQYAYSHKVLCVASAGNSGQETVVYPAGWKKVDGVASTDNKDMRSSFSNYGDDLVSLAAPGENLITVYPGGHYAMVSGTSFSAALVSGASALLKQIDSRMNQNQADAALSEAQEIGQELGAGRLDVFRACRYAARH